MKPACKLGSLRLLDQRGEHLDHISYCSELRRNEKLSMFSGHYRMIGCGDVTQCCCLGAARTYVAAQSSVVICVKWHPSKVASYMFRSENE